MAGWTEALASGISATDGLLGTWAAAMGNKRQMKRAYKLQRKQFDYESKENDKYTRALASDIDSLNVLSRRKAGLNPYAQETEGISPVSNSMPSAPQGFDVPFDKLATIGNDAISGYLASVQAQNIKADTEGKEIENKWKNPLKEKEIANLDAAIELAKSGSKLNYSNAAESDENRNKIVLEIEQSKEKFPEVLRNLQLTNDELDAKIDEIFTDIHIKTEMLPLQMKLANAQIYQAYAAGKLSYAQAKYYYESCAILGEELNKLQRDNKIGDATMCFEIAGAVVDYSNKHKESKGLDLDNELKELQEGVVKGQRYWTEKTATEKVDYVFGKVGQVVGIASQVGLGYGGIQHGMNQKSQRNLNKQKYDSQSRPKTQESWDEYRFYGDGPVRHY